MKKLITPILLAICIILAFLLYKEYSKNNQEFELPKGLISSEKAAVLEKNYFDNQYQFINENLVDNNGVAYQDSRAIRFEINEIENYIHYVKQEAKKQELEGELSLRIYLGAKEVKFESEEQSVMRTTMFFIPTHKEITRNPEEKHKTIDGVEPLNYGSSGDPKNVGFRTGG